MLQHLYVRLNSHCLGFRLANNGLLLCAQIVGIFLQLANRWWTSNVDREQTSVQFIARPRLQQSLRGVQGLVVVLILIINRICKQLLNQLTIMLGVPLCSCIDNSCDDFIGCGTLEC